MKMQEEAAVASWEAGSIDEFVAIGIVDDEDVLWWALNNTADPADGRGEFLVAPEDLQPVLTQMAEARGHLRLGMDVRRGIDRMLRMEYIVLWHTHINTTEPSAEDIAEFPRWLADMGMVYHVPTQTTTLYNHAGIIHNSGVPATSLATDQEG